jgi:predicted RND superfamily exporter protein
MLKNRGGGAICWIINKGFFVCRLRADQLRRITTMLAAYINFINRFRWVLAVFFIVLLGLSIGVAKQLKLKSDFKVLLPENFQSVQDLNRIISRVTGEGTLIIAVESNDPHASIRFGDALVAKLKEYPPEYISDIEYNISDAKKFFESNKYLFMNLDDLQQVYERLDRKIQNQKLKSTGLLLDFQTEEEKNEVFESKDIEEKYKSKTSRYEDYIDGYYFGEGGKLMAIIVKPPGTASGIDFSRKLVAKVYATIAEVDPSKYAPEMKVGLTGKFRRTLFEYQTLINDILSTAFLCMTLVGLAILFYYRRFRMVALMAWVVLNGVAWAFALTQWTIGYLNTQTAFLGSIIIGNGINYSLIFMARYLEERKLGKGPLESQQIAIPATFEGTLASSLNTAVAFGVLVMTQIKGFSQFGFIGAAGMIGCWVATYTVLPVFLMISEQIWPVISSDKPVRWDFSIMAPFADKLQGWSKKLVMIGAGMAVLSVPLLIHYIPNSLEYDFTKLRVKMKGSEVSEEADLNNRVKKIFLGSLSPAVLVADRTDQVLPLCQEIMRKNSLDPVEHQVIDSCNSLYTYVPEHQDEKIALLKKIKDLLTANETSFLTPVQKKQVEDFKNSFSDKHVVLADLPEALVKKYREKNGDVGKVVYVSPTDKAPLWNGKNLIHFADIISKNTLPNGDVIRGSGDSVIFADLLRAVSHDGPRATLYSLLGVCLVVMLIYRNKEGIVFIIGTLLLGVLLMGGLVALLNFKINFFNFIAIPTTFGIGVDYGVNIYQRYRLEGKAALPKVLKTTGSAVALCSLTTIIGYSTLIIAQNQALVSFGWIAIIGEVTCLFAALVLVPAFLIWKSQVEASRLQS